MGGSAVARGEAVHGLTQNRLAGLAADLAARPGIDEMRDVRARLMENGQLTPQTRAVFDLRNVETVPGYHEVASIIAAAMKTGGLPLQRAYLVGSAVQFGLVSQMKALAPAGITIEIFFSEPEAMAWLKGGLP